MNWTWNVKTLSPHLREFKITPLIKMVILEKVNKLKLTRPKVLVDSHLTPHVKHPLPGKSGFAISIVGPAGSGKTSAMVSMIKSKDGYYRRFENIITVIPSSSIASLKANPFRDLDDGNKYEALDLESLDSIIESVEENREEDEYTLLILDDVSAELQDAVILKRMMRVFLNRRHLLLSIIVLSHSLTGKGALPYVTRKNISHLMLFRPACGLEVVNAEYLHLPRDKFKELTEYCFNKKHNHSYSIMSLHIEIPHHL